MDCTRDLSRKPGVLILITFAVSFMVFYVYFGRSGNEDSAVLDAPRPNPGTPLKFEVKSCEIFATPALVNDRLPQILQAGRVKMVDYNSFPDDGGIQCVKHYAAYGDAKICVMNVNKDALISGALRTTQGWEPHITKAFKSALNICPDCQVLDFGANLGVYGLIGASANRRVFAVEPMNENLMYLVKSVRVNNWQKRFKIISNTLSNVYEEMEFWRPYRNAGGSIAVKVGQPAPDRREYDGPFDRIASIQIDNLLEVMNFDKAVMKIDIEGYEPKAFSGASRFFDQMDIPFIFMEWSNKGANKDALKMAQDLSRRGYVAHDPHWNNLGAPTEQNVAKWPFDIIWKRIKN